MLLQYQLNIDKNLNSIMIYFHIKIGQISVCCQIYILLHHEPPGSVRPEPPSGAPLKKSDQETLEIQLQTFESCTCSCLGHITGIKHPQLEK